MGIEVCDAVAQECYALSTALVAVGLMLYGITVFTYACGKRMAELLSADAR